MRVESPDALHSAAPLRTVSCMHHFSSCVRVPGTSALYAAVHLKTSLALRGLLGTDPTDPSQHRMVLIP